MRAVQATAGTYRLKSGTLSSHGRVIRWLGRFPRDARILDVGTAAGYLGAELRRRGFSRIAGVEIDPALAAVARPWYDELVISDVERDGLPWPAGSFDIILCADILEHLREPAEVLRRLMALSKPGGWILVSLPNIAHWSVRLSLLFGSFQYAPSGLLDRGHLRFFTRRSARELLRGAGLTIQRELATPLPIAHWCSGSPWAPVWRALERLDWSLARLRPTLFAYQFVFLCQQPAAEPHQGAQHAEQ